MATEGKVVFGSSHVVYALDNDDGSVGSVWKNLYGNVHVEITATDNSNTFYADNSGYWMTSGSASDDFSIEVARLSDEAKQDLLGFSVDATSGLNYEKVDAVRPSFSLGYEYKGDTDTLRGIKYGCIAKRISETHSTTTDSTDPNTTTIEGTCLGKVFDINGTEEKVIGGYVTNIGATHAGFDAFYTAPPQPGVAPAAA